MKTHNTITKLIAITMAVAALVAADLLGAGSMGGDYFTGSITVSGDGF